MLYHMLGAAEELLEVARGPALLPAEGLGPLFEQLGVVLQDYEERRGERLERMTGEVRSQGGAGGRWWWCGVGDWGINAHVSRES